MFSREGPNFNLLSFLRHLSDVQGGATNKAQFYVTWVDGLAHICAACARLNATNRVRGRRTGAPLVSSKNVLAMKSARPSASHAARVCSCAAERLARPLHPAGE
ncbi:MAG: hypothetical protein RL385_5295 [Pseudomonadota bacterium]